MYEFIKTIISAIQAWAKKEIKKGIANHSQSLPSNIATTDDIQVVKNQLSNRILDITVDWSNALQDATEEIQNSIPPNIATTDDVQTKMDITNPTGTGRVSMNGGTANGSNSYALGNGTTTQTQAQIVSGEFNVVDAVYKEKITQNHTTDIQDNTYYYFANSYNFDVKTGLFTLVNPVRMKAYNVTNQYMMREATSGNSIYYLKYVYNTITGSTGYKIYRMRCDVYSALADNDIRGKYVHIIGNGTADDARSNAHTLDWDGNAWYAGDVYVGGTNQDDAEKLVKISDVEELLGGLEGDVAKESWVNENFQPKGNYATETQLTNVEKKIPTKTSQLTNDSNLAYKTDIPTTLPASDVADWAKQPNKPTYNKSDVGLGNVDNVQQYSASNPPPYPVTSVNGQTGAVDVEPKGTAAQTTSQHNTSEKAHSDIRLLLENLVTKVNDLLDSDDTTLDQMSEVVAYIKDNRELLESVTTNKVNVVDIIDNLTTSVANKPLSAKQGVALKALIDAIKVPTKLSELSGDSTHRTVTDSEKSTWNAKSNFSGNYSDLNGKPTNVSSFNNDAGYIKTSEQQSVIDTALAQAKASGKFDGKNGRSIYTAKYQASENPDNENTYEFNTSAINTNGREIQVDDLIICLDSSREFELYQVGSIISGYAQCSYLGKLKGDKGDAYTLTATDKATIVNAVIQALPVYAGEVV